MEPVRRILLVDDEPSTTDMLQRLLKLQRYEVTTAGSAAEAIAAARATPFDLILTDIHLPDRPGTEVVRQINQDRKVPAIALTGWAPEDIKDEDTSLFVTVLMKPVKLDQLLAAVKQALGGSES